MGQEFTVKSELIEDKINQLLPSQAGFGAGVDITASTTVIPIVDLTETAEGSLLRQDLQTAFGINSSFNFIQASQTVTIINTTGYYRLFGVYRSLANNSTLATISITDGITTKNIIKYAANADGANISFDIVIFLKAGTSCVAETDTNSRLDITSRQIADVNGNLTNPS